MDGEIRRFIKVWMVAITCIWYCYYIAAGIPRGVKRLISLIPILYVFTILPLDLHSFHLGAPTSFFLVWLANFKLLLFAFDRGPLYQTPPTLFHFISIASLPIQIRQHPSPITKNPITKPVPSSVLFSVKALLLATIIHMYQYRSFLHPHVTLALYCFHMYLGIEIVLALCAVPVRAIFRYDLEPQFNEPYLSTSLQDFWGRRWNLMVSSILRPTIYGPVSSIVARVIGPKWASVPAMVSVFVVSGLMHEVIYYHLTRAPPTWEVTWFFLLQGICTATEVVVKKAVKNRWRLHGAVSGPVTLGFLAVTGNWLFFPQLLRNGVHEKGITEYAILVDFVKANLPIKLFN
ncbi:hypothetical protein FNV43_RR03814 [Rhamnella rubrinervis]|uniref:Wax synthase domain-containing protein n=1 Tax=Rhamnella rubrinervis TaxID=2594499 RepID=A0A8K0HKL0_9ROSA|nr:hypothetical protein FNV43_RR03814 [Rhamnella rubrinervis]